MKTIIIPLVSIVVAATHILTIIYLSKESMFEFEINNDGNFDSDYDE